MIVADLSMAGLGHVYFNSAFLRILLDSLHDTNNIHLYVEREHFKYLKERISDKRIIEHLFNLKQRFGIGILFQDILASLILLYIIIKSEKNQKILLLNRLPLTLLTCNILNIIFRRNIYNVLHGELEYFVNPNVTGATKYYYKLFKLAYWISTSSNSYIFLGESIKNEVFKVGIRFGKAKFIVIDHPYEYNIENKYNISQKKEITIGMIGSATARKNCFMLADLKPMITNMRISILNIGKADIDMQSLFDYQNISYFKKNLTDEEYQLLIDKLDYSLCFYDKNINIALASGSFFDSIKFAKPIIALRGNPYVDYYFDKLGDIGYRFDSLEEMADFINSLDESVSDHYCTQFKNLKRAQEILSITTITSEFCKQFYEKN